MQLVLNNNTFDVQSFTEILSFREGENGKYANMALMIYLLKLQWNVECVVHH